MTVRVFCYTCGKQWRKNLELETNVELYAFSFCNCCEKRFLVEFEGQFPKAQLIPQRVPKLRLEEEDGA